MWLLLWLSLLFRYLLFTASCVGYYLIVLFYFDSLCFSFVCWLLAMYLDCIAYCFVIVLTGYSLVVDYWF